LLLTPVKPNQSSLFEYYQLCYYALNHTPVAYLGTFFGERGTIILVERGAEITIIWRRYPQNSVSTQFAN
jgi:hypothetical protein